MTWEYGVAYKALQGVTRGYKGLQGVTGSYKGLQAVTGSYKGLQGVTRSDKTLHGVTRDYRNSFLTRTFPDTFSSTILHKNQSSSNLKFLPKTMDTPLWKNSDFAFFVHSCFCSL